MTSRFRFALTGCLALLLLTGCSQKHIPSYTPHKKQSYVVRGHNYTFAIYNVDHRLLTHPVEDLLAEMKWRKALAKPPISDIYLISHGWNYTLPLAVANYHNYMERIDQFIRDGKPPATFQPYFIFVTWTSTTRPTTNIVKAILPFGMDSALEPLTNSIDKVPLHMLSAWKQSLNAAQTALGPQYPNDYLGMDWEESPYGYFDTNIIQDADETMGEDVPVSALIYRLIKQKQIPPLALSNSTEKCATPDPFDPQDDVCVSLATTQLHLVGHSYGAKLVTVAGMEALRRWMLESIAAHPNRFRHAAGCEQSGKGASDLLKDLASCELTGHRKPFGELEIVFGGLQKPPLLKEWYDKTQETPVSSLVLFNPAFHPGELSYPVDVVDFAPTQTLRFIPRKAIVYTTHDYANGALFALRENLLNTQITQIGNQASKKLDQLIYQKDNKWLKFPGYLVQTAIGPVDMAYSLIYTHIGEVFYSLVNIPWDFWHHVKNGTLGGLYEPISDSDFGWQSIGKGMVNTVDFFMPTNLFYRDESEQGFFRLNKPGLGKTGLNHLAEGRLTGANLWGLEDYYSAREPFGKAECAKNRNPMECQRTLAYLKGLKKPPFAPNIGPSTFSRFTAKPFVEDMQPDVSPGESLWLREKFYSFDAKQVYNARASLVGAHSDLRKPELPNKEDCDNEASDCEGVEKREATFNFVFNFTKTHFERKLCELNPEEIQEFGVVCASEERGN
ncbi:MAG: hypothetical protein ACXWUD_07040 [Methylosarcina sp.]